MLQSWNLQDLILISESLFIVCLSSHVKDTAPRFYAILNSYLLYISSQVIRVAFKS